MNSVLVISIIMTVVGAATPLLLAALGELVAEKSGVLNLGLEGMMLIGAVTGFAVVVATGIGLVGVLAAMAAATLAALLFAWLTLTLTSNQVATGLALTIFGIGLSSLAGEGYVGMTVEAYDSFFPAFLADHPVGRVVFGYSPIVYFSFAMTAAVGWFLTKSRAGLVLRAVGENADSAHSIGYSVIGVRYCATAFGGAMAGIGGCYYALVLTPLWAERLTAGRGWIALALVVFAAWRPRRLLLGAYLFGAVITLELHAKAAGVSPFAPEVLAAMPYAATIVVLALIASRKAMSAKGGTGAPGCLGQTFKPST